MSGVYIIVEILVKLLLMHFNCNNSVLFTLFKCELCFPAKTITNVASVSAKWRFIFVECCSGYDHIVTLSRV